MKLILLSLDNLNDRADFTVLFIFLFPILTVLPCGFSYINEHNSGVESLVRIRTGGKKHMYVKLLSAFVGTFAIFAIPLIIDITFTGLTFPINAKGDLLNYSIYSSDYLSVINKYWFSDLFYKNTLLYTIIFSLVLSMFAGILGSFTVALSYAFPLKYRVFLVLPVYFIMNLTIALDGDWKRDNISLAWYENCMLFGEYEKNGTFVLMFLVCIFVLIGLFVFIGNQRRKKGRVQV
jgi:hypothetical protein